MTRKGTATAAFSSSAQAPAASREAQSEPRRGQRESRRLRRLHHHQVPSLVRAARRKCHQRPFHSAPHFRPEPQSPRRLARAAATAGASRDRSGKPRENQTAPSGGSGPALLRRLRSGRAGTGFLGFFSALPPPDQSAPFHKSFSEVRKASQYKPRTIPLKKDSSPFSVRGSVLTRPEAFLNEARGV